MHTKAKRCEAMYALGFNDNATMFQHTQDADRRGQDMVSRNGGIESGRSQL